MVLPPPLPQRLQRAASVADQLPRLRYMGSKHRVVPHLMSIFARLRFNSALDAFNGSAAVGYALKAMGKRVVTNDFLNFPATVARSIIENSSTTLERDEIEKIAGPPTDGRTFIQTTFRDLYFPEEDHQFLDSAWSHVDNLPLYKRELAISALCLAAARKQPRGVFTVTDFRYDDGRRSMHLPLRELFVECAESFNQAVFDNGQVNLSFSQDVFDLDVLDIDLVYLDPPYVPPNDDNDYIKRYHFLEGLSLYWQGQEIMHDTKTKKLAKRFTPFAYKRTIVDALGELFFKFRGSKIALSYSTNSIPSQDEILVLLRKAKPRARLRCYAVPHRYHFGTHSSALRREATELIFVAS